MNLETIIDKNRVRQSFSRQAHVYEENAPLQKDVAEKLVSNIHITSLNSPLTALDIGIGTGFATKEMLSRFPGIKSFGCDIAWGMLKEAGKTGAFLAEADAEHLPYKDSSFDLAFSSLALQWTALQRSAAEAFRVLKPGGSFHFSTFGESTLTELRDSIALAWTALGLDSAPKTMGYESGDTIGRLMESAGFKNTEVISCTIRDEYPSPEALLRSLKAIGAGNPSKDFNPSPRLLAETFKVYRREFGCDAGVTATFEIIYVSGVKP